MAKEGSTRVEIAGHEDKRQITAVFGCTMAGDFLPPQLIYFGKTPKCLPSVKFADNWNITYTMNHWANEETTLTYIDKILVPYKTQKQRELSLNIQHPALVLFDCFKGQVCLLFYLNWIK
uniref:DDE-1 domain-containing protein n=1 Tax=Amphimedon queenslandica TaxID=400682 RepID=A0A1X7TZ04_AMPQE